MRGKGSQRVRFMGGTVGVAGSWDELGLGGLRDLARCALAGYRGWGLALRFGCRSLGLRVCGAPPGGAPAGERPVLWVRPWGGKGRARFIDPFTARDIGSLAGFLFRDERPGGVLRPVFHSNPLRRAKGRLGWAGDLSDVQLGEFLLALDALQALSESGGIDGGRAALGTLLWSVWRAPGRGGVRPPVESWTERAAARTRRAFGTMDGLVGVWIAQGLINQACARFPDLFGSGGDGGGQGESAGDLVYGLCGGDITRAPAVRAGYLLDTLLMLRSLQAQARRQAARTAGITYL